MDTATEKFQVCHRCQRQSTLKKAKTLFSLNTVILQLFVVLLLSVVDSFLENKRTPKWAKNTLSDHDSIHGHRNLNEIERSMIAHHRNFNAKKSKITAPNFLFGLTIEVSQVWKSPPPPPLLFKNLFFLWMPFPLFFPFGLILNKSFFKTQKKKAPSTLNTVHAWIPASKE